MNSRKTSAAGLSGRPLAQISPTSMLGTPSVTDRRSIRSDLSDFYVAVQGSVYGDDPSPAVNDFVKKYTEETGAPPATQYAFPGYVLIDLWAKAVERAGTTETAAVVAELEKMNAEPTIFGPRTFTPELHHQNSAEYRIIEVQNGKAATVGTWTLSEPIPLEALMK